MILCTKCKKRPAVVFVTRMEGGNSTNEGYCLSCAKEMGLPPVNDMLQKFGISDEDMEQMEEQEVLVLVEEAEDLVIMENLVLMEVMEAGTALLDMEPVILVMD